MEVKVSATENKTSAEDRIAQIYSEKCKKITNFNSKMYYVSFVFLNILMLILSLIYLNNKDKIESVKKVWEHVNVKSIILIIGIFVCIMLLKTLPNFLKLYSRTKKRKFGLMYRAVAAGEFYSIMTAYSSGEKPMFCKYLSRFGVSEKHSVDMGYSKRIFSRIANLLYCTIMLVLGFVFWMRKDISIWLCILVCIPLVYNAIIVTTVICFNNNKKATINFIASICKFLYSWNIIKDYEKLYNKIIDNLLIYNKEFRQNKILIFIEISAYILAYFLKGVLLYYALVSLNIANIRILSDVLFRYVILDLIISMWPLQKGSLIFEFLFITLYSKIFFTGYVFWGMIILRVFEYFIYILQYLIVMVYDKLCYKLVKKSAK